MGYRSDSIAVSRDMGALSLLLRLKVVRLVMDIIASGSLSDNRLVIALISARLVIGPIASGSLPDNRLLLRLKTVRLVMSNIASDTLPDSRLFIAKNILRLVIESIASGSLPENVLSLIRGQKVNTNCFFSNFSGAAGISHQNPGISRQESLISLVSRDIPKILAPTNSWGRPLTHRKISGLKSLGLCSFFVPDLRENQYWQRTSQAKMAADRG